MIRADDTQSEPVFLSQGVFPWSEGDRTGAQWRLWSPKQPHTELVLFAHGSSTQVESVLKPTERVGDYLIWNVPEVTNGHRYFYRVPGQGERPDPMSRWQPDGVHRPSAVFFPEQFAWSDHEASWAGVPQRELSIYELHVGTFTPEGTLDAAIGRLKDLAELGITAVEVMPLSQFPGTRNWGYDGVHPYAVQNSYGGPEAFLRFVDAAHQAGIAVLLDIVYNHLGPEGNYLGVFGNYFHDHYHTPWGSALNYDGYHSEPVRRYIIDNACMWIRDFHLDGLRLDAIQEIYDLGACHVLEDLAREAHAINPMACIIGETNQNDPRQVRSRAAGGWGLNAVWSDDFHHAVHAALTHESDGYYQDYGSVRHVASAFRDWFVYHGNYSEFRKKRYGRPVTDLEPTVCNICVQNHDQVGNRAFGDRLSTLLSPEAYRLACGLLLIAPNMPLLFMGQEYGETRPFPFFCSFLDQGLVRAVREGRKREFRELAFKWGGEIPDPQATETYDSARLSWEWPEGSPAAGIRALHRQLLGLRRRWYSAAYPSPVLAMEEVAPAGNGEDLGFCVRSRSKDDPLPWFMAACNLTAETVSAEPFVPGFVDALAAGGTLLSTAESQFGGPRPQWGHQLPGELLPFEMLLIHGGN